MSFCENQFFTNLRFKPPLRKTLRLFVQTCYGPDFWTKIKEILLGTKLLSHFFDFPHNFSKIKVKNTHFGQFLVGLCLVHMSVLLIGKTGGRVNVQVHLMVHCLQGLHSDGVGAHIGTMLQYCLLGHQCTCIG